jgi:hypothetical protein
LKNKLTMKFVSKTVIALCVPGIIAVDAMKSESVTRDQEDLVYWRGLVEGLASVPTSAPVARTNAPELPEEVQNELITCIAVIDENSNFNQISVDAKWEELREQFPDRRFCLLQPTPARDVLLIPTGFFESNLNTYQEVNRDAANTANPSDWFQICGLSTELEMGITRVGLYIDNSGSMYTSTVQASYDLFLQKTNAAGFFIVEGTENADEDMIGPCLSTTSQVATTAPVSLSPVAAPAVAPVAAPVVAAIPPTS